MTHRDVGAVAAQFCGRRYRDPPRDRPLWLDASIRGWTLRGVRRGLDALAGGVTASLDGWEENMLGLR